MPTDHTFTDLGPGPKYLLYYMERGLAAECEGRAAGHYNMYFDPWVKRLSRYLLNRGKNEEQTMGVSNYTKAG